MKKILSILGLAAVSTASWGATISAIAKDNLILDASVFTAKYRMSNTNFDQSIDDGRGTTIIGGQPTFISNGIGNNSQMSNVTYNFSIEHIAGEGFIFKMNSANVLNPTNFELGWGDFTTTPAQTSTVKYATQMGAGTTPGNPFNILHIEARADNSAFSMAYSNLVFTGLDTVGLITGQTASGGIQDQWLYSSSDLSQINWKLTGQLIGARTGAGGDETVRWTLSAKSGSAVPEPSTWAMLALPLAGAAFARLRRR
jgi:hypothetical protein